MYIYSKIILNYNNTMNNNYIIYKFTSPSGKSYIGQTNDLAKRITQHKYKSSKCPYFSNAVQKYGLENFKLDILAEHLTLDESNKLEEHLINEHNTLHPMGYNLKLGGQNHTHHLETRKKMSLLKIGVKRKPRSLEYRKNISLAHTGVKRGPISDEHKQALLSANLGRKNSEETIQKMKIAKQNMSEETKQKMRKPKSKESIDKRSLTNTGRKLVYDPILGKRIYIYPNKQ